MYDDIPLAVYTFAGYVPLAFHRGVSIHWSHPQGYAYPTLDEACQVSKAMLYQHKREWYVDARQQRAVDTPSVQPRHPIRHVW